MTHDYPADVQLTDKRIDEFVPRHAHDVLIEMDKHDVVDAEAAPDYLLAPQRAVDKRHVLSENEHIRMHVKAQNRRNGVYLFRALFRLFQQRRVSQMHPVEKAEGYRSFYLWHGITPQRSFL